MKLNARKKFNSFSNEKWNGSVIKEKYRINKRRKIDRKENMNGHLIVMSWANRNSHPSVMASQVKKIKCLVLPGIAQKQISGKTTQ